jgi:plasmid stabilization system protein ParE
MSGYAFTPLAKADVFAIWSYIAENSEDAANRVEQAIYDTARLLPRPPCAAIPGPTSQPVRLVFGR